MTITARIVYNHSSIPHHLRAAYDQYILTKSQTEGLTSKPGFIYKTEVEKIALNYKATKRSYVNKLNTLTAAGFIKKNKYGYILTSTNTIHNNFNLNKSKKIKKGKEYSIAPYINYALPITNDVKIIEVMRLYILINQIYQRYNFIANGITTGKKYSTRPENFALSVEKIMVRGGYKSKMEVWRLINLLENVNLIKITRGKSGMINGEANRYTLLSFANANWSNLYKAKRISQKEKWNRIIGKIPNAESPVLASSTVQKKKTVYNSAEQIFMTHLKNGLQDVLVNADLLSNKYLSFAGKQRKVTKKMLPKLLTYCLNDPSLKAILMKDIKNDQILLSTKEGTYVNINANVYDRYNHFVYDQPVLVERNGNYKGQVLRTKENEYNKAKFAALVIMRPETTCII